MSASEQPIGPREAWALSRILQGLPSDGVEIDTLDDRLRQLARKVSGERNGTAAVAIFTRELAAWTDGAEIMKAVFSADPEEEHPPEPHHRFRVLSVADILAIEAPSWRIDGLLQQGALSLLYSPAGGGKTFGALAMAFSIATGRDCFGFTTQPATVAYLVAEGHAGMGVRVRAYLEHHGIEQPVNLHFLAGAISLMDAGQVLELIAELRRLKVEVLFVDTLARSMDGGDENSTRDMSLTIANIELIRSSLACDVILVHHSGYDESRERGSSALRAALDTKLAMRGAADELVLTVEKHRDWETGLEVPLRLTVVDLGDGVSSCVIERRDKSSSRGLKKADLAALRVLVRDFLEEGATASEWKTACEGAGIQERNFFSIRGRLLRGGYVTVEQDETGKAKRGARYACAVIGRQALQLEGDE
jgi:hypothetical protein